MNVAWINNFFKVKLFPIYQQQLHPELKKILSLSPEVFVPHERCN